MEWTLPWLDFGTFDTLAKLLFKFIPQRFDVSICPFPFVSVMPE